MAYIGTIPAEAYTSFAVQHFTTSATDTFTLDFPVANENEIALFINNVRQEPGSSYAYTASGTTLTLSSAITGSDSMYCVFIGKAVQTVTPASGSVTNDMLAGSIATSKLADGSTFATTNGITVATEFRLTADTNTNTNGDITTNWEVVDDASYSSLGSPVTESSGVFSFPQTGIYLAICTWMINITGSDTFAGVQAQTTLDNSSYTIITENSDGANHSRTGSANSIFIVDVTDTSNVKVKFRTDSFSNANLGGSTTVTKSGVVFIRLGDT